MFLIIAIPHGGIFAENFPSLDPRISEKNNAELIKSEQRIKEKLGKDPANAELYYELAEIYTVLFDRTRKKSADATEWLFKTSAALEKAVMLDPDHKVALYNLGVVYKRQGRMERARDELRRAIRKCDPETDGHLLAAIWMQIGMIYEEQGFYDAAKEAYEKARDYDYGNDEIRNSLLDLKERKAAEKSYGSPSSYGFTPGMPTRPIGPAYDPLSGTGEQPQGVEQLLPALGSMFSQKAQQRQDYDEWAQ